MDQFKAAQEGPARIAGEHHSDYNQRFVDFMLEMDELDRSIFWTNEQDRRNGEHVGRADVYRICAVFGENSTNCNEVSTRFDYSIALGTKFKIECGNEECILTTYQ